MRPDQPLDRAGVDLEAVAIADGDHDRRTIGAGGFDRRALRSRRELAGQVLANQAQCLHAADLELPQHAVAVPSAAAAFSGPRKKDAWLAVVQADRLAGQFSRGGMAPRRSITWSG